LPPVRVIAYPGSTMARRRGLGTHITLTFGRQLAALALNLGFAALVARALGPAGQGQYALAVLLPSLIFTFANLGLPVANAYFLGKGEVGLETALRANGRLWLGLSPVGLLVGALVLRFFGERWFPGVPPPLMDLALLAYPALLLQAVLASLLQGVQDFDRYNFSLLVQLLVALPLAAAAILVWGWGPYGAVLAYVASFLLSAGAAWSSLRGRRGEGRRELGAAEYARRCIRYGWQAQVSVNLAFLSYRADTFLVNYFISPAATGLYVVAVVIAEKIWLLSHAVGSILLPRLSSLEGDEAARTRITPLATKLVFLFSVAGGTLIFGAAHWIVPSLFGSAYEPSVGVLRWLMPGVVALSVARTLSVDLTARGRMDLNVIVGFAALAANIAANLVLIPRYGIEGAAMATTFSYSGNLVAKLWLYKRLSGYELRRFLRLERHERDTLRRKITSLRTPREDGR
jgi:O-antigen/teichoic acid export membrane protein